MVTATALWGCAPPSAPIPPERRAALFPRLMAGVVASVRSASFRCDDREELLSSIIDEIAQQLCPHPEDALVSVVPSEPFDYRRTKRCPYHKCTRCGLLGACDWTAHPIGEDNERALPEQP